MKSPRLVYGTLLLLLAVSAANATNEERYQKATFAGGCFWCMQPPFDAMQGVVRTTVGYTGGSEVQPSYDQVSSGRTSHTEAVEVVFDTQLVTYDRLLTTFWRNIDPLSANGQFCDRGSQYRSAVFYHDTSQKERAERAKADVERRLGQAVVTEVVAASAFYPAEEYHQMYYKKNPDHYKRYRQGCGRDKRLAEIWGSASPQ